VVPSIYMLVAKRHVRPVYEGDEVQTSLEPEAAAV
jgi:acyl dehydratase